MIKKDIFWFYGYSGAGKTTLGTMFAEKLKYHYNKDVVLLDGDIHRKKKTKKSFTDQGRFENIRQMMFLAEEIANTGKIVVACFTTPHRGARAMLRHYLGDRLCLIYIIVSDWICWKRDPKGLYKKIIAGEITNFSGADLRFDVPFTDEPDIPINVIIDSKEVSLQRIFDIMKVRNIGW